MGEEKENGTVLESFELWVDTTAMHGVSHIYRRPTLFRRLMWFLFVATSFSFLVYQLNELMKGYSALPTNVVITTSIDPDRGFPAVTFCDMNGISLMGLQTQKNITRQIASSLVDPQADPEYQHPWYDPNEYYYGDSPTDSPSGNYTGNETSTNSAVTSAPAVTGAPRAGSNIAVANVGAAAAKAGSNIAAANVGAAAARAGSNVASVNEATTPSAYSNGSLNDSFTSTELYSAKLRAATKNKFVQQFMRLTDAQRKSISKTYKDFMLMCSFLDEPCNESDFRSFTTIEHGTCFTFNSEAKFRVYDIGPRHGLSFVLFVNESDAIPSLSDTFGVKLVIHEQAQMPLPDSEGFAVLPGRHAFIRLKLRKYHYTTPPHGKCKSYTEKEMKNLNMYYRFMPLMTFNQEACLRTCIQEKIIKRCGCYYPYYGLTTLLEEKYNTTLEACDIVNSTYCLKDEVAQKLERKKECQEICMASCDTKEYNPSLSSGTWPSEPFYRSYLRSGILDKQNFADALNRMNGSISEEIDFIRNSLVKVTIYYETLMTSTYEEVPLYTWNKLLSDFGGQVGLCMGFSLLTVLEIVELLIDIFVKTCKGFMSQNNAVKKFEA